jgi:hypothetical protein
VKTILYVAVIFFCQEDRCSVVSKGIPYDNATQCRVELDKKVNDLKKQGLSPVEGRCLDIEFRKYI